MNYDLVFGGLFVLGVVTSAVGFVAGQVQKKRARKRAMAAVYERRSHVECTPRVVGYNVRISRIPMPPPESRGFFHPELGEPFEWVADKDDESRH